MHNCPLLNYESVAELMMATAFGNCVQKLCIWRDCKLSPYVCELSVKTRLGIAAVQSFSKVQASRLLNFLVNLS